MLSYQKRKREKLIRSFFGRELAELIIKASLIFSWISILFMYLLWISICLCHFCCILFIILTFIQRGFSVCHAVRFNFPILYQYYHVIPETFPIMRMFYCIVRQFYFISRVLNFFKFLQTLILQAIKVHVQHIVN